MFDINKDRGNPNSLCPEIVDHVKMRELRRNSLKIGAENKDLDTIAFDIMSMVFGTKEVFGIELNLRAQIKECVKEALMIGKDPIPPSTHPAAPAIAKDAEEFEKTLPPGTDTFRVVASHMPWGWAYLDKELQMKFREFCNRPKNPQ